MVYIFIIIHIEKNRFRFELIPRKQNVLSIRRGKYMIRIRVNKLLERF